MNLKPNHPALAKAVTIHPKMLRQPTDAKMMLKSVADNDKLGKGRKYVSKGKWRGMAMFQLSLEERRTCPSSCQQWSDCYGNNMAFAHRFDHTSPDFYEKLNDELKLLTRKHYQGVVIRLHVLGDFFDEQYVKWWMHKLKEYRNLHIFGFTAHKPDSPIGDWINAMNGSCDRSWVRFSNSGDAPMAANVGDMGPGIPCPEQTGKTESCLTCGVCWSTINPVNFKEH